MPNDPRVLSAAMKLADRYVLARRTPAGGIDLSMADVCNAWRNAVTGALVTLWVYADEHIRDDDTLPLTSQTLDAVVGIEGFFDAMPREWIDELDDGSIVLPGYCEKNSLIAKRKRTASSNARVTQWRRSKKANGNGVTNKHVTQCNAAGDLDQDLDEDKSRKKNPTASSTPDWFEDFRHAYPKRSGDQGWRKAERAAHARVSEGHAPDELLAGAKRYAAYCESTNKIGTEFVKQAATFLGPDKPFLDDWKLPPTKAEVRQDANVAASLAWMEKSNAAA